MSYKTLRKAFHDPGCDQDTLYTSRFNSESSVHLDMVIEGSPMFFVMVPDVYENLLRASYLDKDILRLVTGLPGKAIEDYRNSCLIDEVVMTNKIEGVNSTRREIDDTLKRLEKNDRRGRFHGLVSKYQMLQRKDIIQIKTCQDVRDIYNDLVLDEVAATDSKDVPDGEIFRAGEVIVCDSMDRPIHHGLSPEPAIIEAMDKSLLFLNDEKYDPIIRVSVFHFLFGYIHPFYDGNGRTNRFISSYILSREYEPTIAYRLSCAIKEKIEKYYGAFSACEHVLNKGDLTPFILMFSDMVVRAMTSLKEALEERRGRLAIAEKQIEKIPDIYLYAKLENISDVLIQAALFADYGITADELVYVFEISRPTLYKRLAVLEASGLLAKRRVGHSVYYKMNMDKLEEL